MVKIYLPQNNLPEKKYIIDFIFEKLGLQVTYQKSEKDYIIEYNGIKLTIKDDFFYRFSNDDEYLSKDNIPKKIEFSNFDGLVSDKLPIIYGNSDIKVDGNKIYLSADIIASAYFLLSGWEEYVAEKCDQHERFSYKDNFAYKHNFINIPVVNGYILLLGRLLGIKPQNMEFKLLLTHDIDAYKKFYSPIKLLIGHLIKRFSLKLFIKDFKECLLVKSGIKKDPYDRFEKYFEAAKELSCEQIFFVIFGGDTKYDGHYNVEDIIDLLNLIEKSDAKLGIHYSYNALKNKNIITAEINKFKKLVGRAPEVGRAHYLRFFIPDSYKLLEDNGIKEDHSIGYSAVNGFRRGICLPYKPYDFIKREVYNFLEIPLTFMDTHTDVQKSISEIRYFYKKVKEYGGIFSVLLHNSTEYDFTDDLINVVKTEK